jgi:hypothetical protein
MRRGRRADSQATMWRIYLSLAAGAAATAVSLIRTHETELLVLGGVLLATGASALRLRRLARKAAENTARSNPFSDSD